METARIAELLQIFLPGPLTELHLASISTYIDLLLRWNTRVNLTAVSGPEHIVTRHFGESLFAARHLFPSSQNQPSNQAPLLIDVGSGAGFPGLPIKIWNPGLRVTLIDSNQKKATFLREVIRTLELTNIDVFAGRTENYGGPHAEFVALRAVEKFDQSLPAAAQLVAPEGKIALFIGNSQRQRAQDLQPAYLWDDPQHIPLSTNRTLLIGTRPSESK